MMVPGVIFDICSWQHSVTFIENFKMTPIMTNFIAPKNTIFPIWKQEDRIRKEFKMMVKGVFVWLKNVFGVHPTHFIQHIKR